VLSIKTSAFCWNNNCVITNTHGKTALKTEISSLIKIRLEKVFKYILIKQTVLPPRNILHQQYWKLQYLPKYRKLSTAALRQITIDKVAIVLEWPVA
jgi:hypothetical protein